MAGSARSWALIAGLAGLVGLQPAACSGKGSDPAANSKAVAAVLADVWPEVVEPSLNRISERALALQLATEALAASASDADRLTAQAAWTELMEAWQEAEMHQIGPAASSISAVGGADGRDRIYSWPTVNPCRVDQETVIVADTGAMSQGLLVNALGLDALEVVLFTADDTNHCPSLVDPNANGSWDALGPAGVREARSLHASLLAAELVAVVDELVDGWDPAAGDFAANLASSGQEGSDFESQEEGLNAVFEALFYLDMHTKDIKLGEPLGLVPCGQTNCLDSVETRIAGGSEVWIQANLRGFRALLLGGEGQGIDDLLRQQDAEDVADALVSALDEADLAAAALTVGVDTAASTDPTAALELHTRIRAVTDLMKGDVATLLLLQIPGEAAGDND